MTIESGQKTSLLIPSQLPEFVRDDPSYANFVLFLEAYYEWLEQNGNLEDRTKNLLNYTDIDETSSEFLQYFFNDFLSYFPDEILADKRKVAKIARQLYQAKGTQAAYRFLFRTLYNTDVEFFYTKDAVLRASAGKWYVAKSVRLADADPLFVECIGFRLFGETSKSIATIEAVNIVGDKIEVFISDIQRLFQSGETVRVVDENNQDVLMEDGMPHMGKIVGQISQIRINPNFRGLLYRPGDPVVVHGGLNSPTGLGATAAVGQTTTGSLQRVKLETGGYGYRADPNTIISITNAPGAVITVSGLNPAANSVANVTFVPIDEISLKTSIQIGALDYAFSNVFLANANTTLANAFTFTGFSTFPLSSVDVRNSGGGITTLPTITAISQYQTDILGNKNNLKNLGILAPIQIISGGEGYQVNDVIHLEGGSGVGANAKVKSVGANGNIETVEYTYITPNLTYPLGGLGYRADALPTANIISANVAAANAVLTIPGILGDGATFSSIVDRVGSITTINILDAGEDYIAAPNVSLKIQDIVVANLSIIDLPPTGNIVYQGTSEANSSYRAVIDSVELLTPFGDPTQSLYRLRVYDYTSTPNSLLPIKVANSSIIMNMTGAYNTINTATRFDSTGLITYGDGTARATASFLNGLVISEGQYLDTTGQPSSFDVLQSEIYNNFTYQITLEKEIAKYRDTLLNLLHPTGMRVIGRYAMKSNNMIDFNAKSALDTGLPLGYYTGDPGSYVTMSSTWDNYSNNQVDFYSLVGANLQNIILPNTSLSITLSNGFKVFSEVENVISNGANTVFLKDNVWLTYANVAYVIANASSNVINITSLTGSYDIINNGEYSNTQYPLKDIVFAGDKILVANNTEKTVQSVDWEGGTITLTTNLANTVNSLMSVQRTVSTTDVIIFGPVGLQYNPELLTQDGRTIVTQANAAILLG